MVDPGRLREPQHAMATAVVPATRAAAWSRREVPIEAAVVGAGRTMDVAQFLALTSTTALVVVVDDVLVHEWYAEGVSVTDRLLGNSATKSALAHLVGVAVHRGHLPDLDAAVCEYVPELAGSGYAQVSVRQVLTMTSGVDWLEDYHDPASRASLLLQRWLEQEGDSRAGLLEIRPGDPPGSRYNYCSPDSLVLDWVRERATGYRYPVALTELWRELGAEQPALVGLDAPEETGGIAMAAGALGATARDWARLGVLQVDGTWQGRRLLDDAWVDASCRPEQPFLCPGRLPSRITTHAGFGYHWWPLDETGRHVMADGMQGQFVYVDRPNRTVVVKTSAWPYQDPWWDRQCRDLSYLALPAIARAARVAFDTP